MGGRRQDEETPLSHREIATFLKSREDIVWKTLKWQSVVGEIALDILIWGAHFIDTTNNKEVWNCVERSMY